MCNVALLICLDCPTQVEWHTKGVVRHGGSKEQATFALDLGMVIAKEFGVRVEGIKGLDELEF